MKYHFYALLEKEDNFYNVSFPDLPGANTFGEGIEDAIEMASDALGGHLLVMEDDNDYIPKSTDYQELAKKLNENEQLQLVKVDTDIVRLREENKPQ
nr:type II toxin-antitoxin system HicB family antitoxin [Mammaliicoccus sp. Marseille-Q6498]